MKATRKLLLLLALAASTAITGCHSTTAKDDSANVKKDSKSDPQKINGDITPVAQKYQEAFFKAIDTKDVKLIRPHLIPELQEKFVADKFAEFADAMIKNGGKIEKVSYLGSLDRGLFKVFVWKFASAKDRQKLPDGSELPRERMFTLVIGQVDGKQLIFSWSFQ